jgi:hypothetical protein
MFGAKVLIADPKGDRQNWGHELPWLKPYINIIELSPEKQFKGRLDIFQVLLQSLTKDADDEQKTAIKKQAAEYALSIYGTVAGVNTGDERMELLADAVNIVAKKQNPCGMMVISTLEELASGNAQAVTKEKYARLAKTFKNVIETTAYGHLLFGDGTEEVVDITKPINIMQTQNLTVPPEGKAEEKFTYSERVGMAAVLTMAAIGIQFALQSRDTLKIFVQDESKMFKLSSEAQAMFTRMVTMGRTENAPLYLIGHNISDLGDSENIKSNVDIKVCFGTTSLEEAENVLKYLKLDSSSDELKKMITDPNIFDTGVCLFQDVHGRVDIVEVNLILDEFVRAFDTVNTTKGD